MDTFRAPEVTPVAFRRSSGHLFPNNGTAVEGDVALYTGVQVAAFVAAALASAKQEWLAELSYSWSCAHRMWDDPNGARCANKDRHEEHTGQCWAVSSDAPDRHDGSEPGNE